jgi:hypothetical protein
MGMRCTALAVASPSAIAAQYFLASQHFVFFSGFFLVLIAQYLFYRYCVFNSQNKNAVTAVGYTVLY